MITLVEIQLKGTKKELTELQPFVAEGISINSQSKVKRTHKSQEFLQRFTGTVKKTIYFIPKEKRSNYEG